MDATVALEGSGPKSGRPLVVDRILCSSDPVALDTVQAVLMGIDPASVRHLATCAARGIGTNDLSRIEIRGPDTAKAGMRFEPARHNAVSLVETLLRKSVLKKLFFNTPLFRLCLIGAKLYYRYWTLRSGRGPWRTVLAHPVYGPQWRGVARARAADAEAVRAGELRAPR
jgi:hypothetical protein